MAGCAHPATRGICGEGGRNIGGVRCAGRRSRPAQGPRLCVVQNGRARLRRSGRGPFGRSRLGPGAFRRTGVLAGARLALRARGPRFGAPRSPDRPRRKSRRSARSRTLREAHTAADCSGVNAPPSSPHGAKRKPGGFPPGFVLLVVELVPIRPCGASGAARDPRGPARPWKARGRASMKHSHSALRTMYMCTYLAPHCSS